MCRIAGLWNFKNNSLTNFNELITEMRDCLAHGGPDSAGLYSDESTGIYLAHRRLSILDLSSAGNQPFEWDRYKLIFNGEVYNFQDVNKEYLSEYNFKSQSDTETIVKAWHKYGPKAIEYLRGMFAFAMYDKIEQELFIVRDRLGVKPLFYYCKDGLLLFASELKSLLKYENLDKTIDQKSVSLFLQQGYIPAPDSIFKYVKKVKPGNYLRINSKADIQEIEYWNAESQYGNNDIKAKSKEEWKEVIHDELIKSFNYRMVADVPVGSFLSGGIDSSLVSAVIQKHSNKQLKTFTIGFHQKDYNEAVYAKEIAQHIGSEHHELYIGEKDFEDILQRLPVLLDEPNGDPSIIPTHIVSEMAKKHVKVSLSADGGDEFFGGYTKYEVAKNFYPKLQAIPPFGRNVISSILANVNVTKLEKFSGNFPILKNYKNLGPKLLKFNNALKANDLIEFFNITSTFLTKREVEKLVGVSTNRLNFDLPDIDKNRIISYLGLIDVKTYLEGDILTKVDRATMHTALEGREPLLDHVLFEKAIQIPDQFKIDGINTKIILREILFDLVPRALIERPKQGFAIPIEKWLKGQLKEIILQIKNDQEFLEMFNFDRDELSRIIDNFYSQNRNPQVVWYVYVLNQWYNYWLK